MDLNPSSFPPLFSDPYNSTNLSTITYIYHLSLSKLPPTSDIIIIFNQVLIYRFVFMTKFISDQAPSQI